MILRKLWIYTQGFLFGFLGGTIGAIKAYPALVLMIIWLLYLVSQEQKYKTSAALVTVLGIVGIVLGAMIFSIGK